MSETYTIFENKDGKVIVCGKRPVLVMNANLEKIANVLNEETAPIIEALEEKALENMQLNERIVELEAALEDATLFGDVNSGEIDFTRLHGKKLGAYFEARKRHLARKADKP